DLGGGHAFEVLVDRGLADGVGELCGHRNTFQPSTLQQNVRAPNTFEMGITTILLLTFRKTAAHNAERTPLPDLNLSDRGLVVSKVC
ncbi:hypothetical protein, partial [Corynebacterium lipophilum]|uniref:hypothetical protein n=1 Tax=Corynebacterium lipophilum TaxID=2804918 RepID=UPI00209620CF